MSELEQQIANRRDKWRQLAERGIDPFPRRADYDLEPSAVLERYGARSAAELEGERVELRVPGRVRGLRGHGKIAFLDLSDGSGKLQVFLRRDHLPEDGWWLFERLDLGDIALAGGTLMRTRAGELTLLASHLEILAKSLRPPPEKWHGLADVEARYRQRYVDLATRPEVRRVFETRAAIVSHIRRFLDERGFLEVETPMMQPIPGGAAARPFVTHHNALDIDLYLRIAPELYLKRLLVGGLHRVYEINRNFRNEGISTHHNPEFTMLEFYWAYSDYRQLMEVTEQMLSSLAEKVSGGSDVEWKGRTLSFRAPFRRLSVRQALETLGGVDADALSSEASLRAELRRRGIEAPVAPGYGHALMTLFDELVEEQLWDPTFIYDYPIEVSPFAKASPEDPRFTERFELFAGGMEMANAFTELNDPEVQAERFHQQLAARDAGDDEAQLFDHDFVRALEHGMPPAGGEGIGIDRLTMVLTDSASIRDVILFPLMRPQAGSDE